MQFDAYQFVQQIRGRYWLGMLAAIDTALVSAARWPATSRRAGPVHPGSDAEFMRFLFAAREYLLSEGRVRPDNISDENFLLLKPMCQHLVESGRFPAERLKCFDSVDPWVLKQLPEAAAPEHKRRV
jgi:hypothetical protein